MGGGVPGISSASSTTPIRVVGTVARDTAPTLIVSGGADRTGTRDKVAEAAARIPNATVHEIPGRAQIHEAGPTSSPRS